MKTAIIKRLDSAFQNAEWHSTSPISDDGRVGLSFDLDNGQVLRLSLSKKDAQDVQQTINEAFYFFSLSQSERSELIPSDETETVSPAGDQV